MEEISLKEGEFHPAAHSAYEWYRQLDWKKLAIAKEAIYSTALSGNRNAELCASTLSRLDKNQPVSDRYLLGLCWTLKDLV